MNANLYVFGNTLQTGNLTVNADVSFNNRLFVGRDVSLNANLYVFGNTLQTGRLIVNADVSFNNRLSVGNIIYANAYVPSTSTSSGALQVLNGGVGINGNIYVGNIFLPSTNSSLTWNNLSTSGIDNFTFPISLNTTSNANTIRGMGIQIYNSYLSNNYGGYIISRLFTQGSEPTGKVPYGISNGGSGLTIGLIGSSTYVDYIRLTDQYGIQMTKNALITGSLTLTNSASNSYIPSTSTTTGALQVLNGGAGIYGNVFAGGSITALSFNATSDYRIKENIRPVTQTIDKLKPIQYYNKKTEKEDIGLIAHEVQIEFPFLITGEKDGEEMQSVNYTGLIAVLIKEIQDLKKRVAELES